MKCYVNVTPAHQVRGSGVGRVGWIGQVISEQDYHERGPHARSHSTVVFSEYDGAKAAATEWAEENGYDIYSVDEIAG